MSSIMISLLTAMIVAITACLWVEPTTGAGTALLFLVAFIIVILILNIIRQFVRVFNKK